eukprot:scaffold77573_cov27-Tisochrysis_lutea.AAC.1
MHPGDGQESDFELLALGTTSQYSHADGASACTTIATIAAIELLLRHQLYDVNLGLVSETDKRHFIDRVLVANGVEVHRSVMLSQRRSESASSTAEHKDFEEVWKVRKARPESQQIADWRRTDVAPELTDAACELFGVSTGSSM